MIELVLVPSKYKCCIFVIDDTLFNEDGNTTTVIRSKRVTTLSRGSHCLKCEQAKKCKKNGY